MLGSPEATTGEEPSDKNSRVYLNNPNNSTSFWIDQRDGKGVLIKLDIKSGKENKLTERGGLRLPAYWLNDNYLIYRISDGRETADYIMNVSGGEPKKITDVTNTTGVNNWNFY